MTKLQNHYQALYRWSVADQGLKRIRLCTADNPANNTPWASFDCASQEDIRASGDQSARRALKSRILEDLYGHSERKTALID